MCLFSGCANQIDPTNRAQILAATLPPSPLKDQLTNCQTGNFEVTRFSIAHRGAPMGYPEHTKEGYLAAIDMGAGVIECDVTFTKDQALVCRHSQCDLHSTTNILLTPLEASCRQGFTPAQADAPASALCCTSDISLRQFKTLCGRRDIVDKEAATIEQYLTIPANPRIDPWASDVSCGTLLTHAESIKLIDRHARDFTPELKTPMVDMPHRDMSQSDYADKMIQEYIDAGIDADRVFPQSFNLSDVQHWIDVHPEFGQQGVFLDPRGRMPEFEPTLENMQSLKASGVNIVAPPIPMLLTLDAKGQLQPSDYARLAKQAGLEIITWTFEAGDPTDAANWLYFGLNPYMTSEAKQLEVLDALARDVGIKGIFSDWPGTVTYYAACRD